MDAEIWQYVLLAAVGLVAGAVNVLAGGGSLLIMPTMLLMGIEDVTVNGTSRVGVVIQNLTAVVAFGRKGFSDFKLSLSLAICAMPGSIAGAWAGTKLRGEWFDRVLAAVMICVLILMSRRKKTGAVELVEAQRGSRRWILGHVLIAVAGFYGGFIQAGVGFILMPILNKVMGLDLVRVNMHKVFIVAAYMIPALVVYAWNGSVWWATGLILAIGTSAGGWIGSHIAVEKGERVIRLVFNITLIALASNLLLRSFAFGGS